MSKIVKIVNYKEDPKREGHTISVESVSQIKRNPTKSKAVLRKPAGAPVWFKSFESNLDQRLNKIDQRLERVEKDINHIVKVNKLVR